MSTAIIWFRQDLRLTDNPALTAAIEDHDGVIPIYIHAPKESGKWQPGAASNWWLHHSLTALDQSLKKLGSKLYIYKGESLDILRAIIKSTASVAVYWNRLYEPLAIKRDTEIKQVLRKLEVEVRSHSAALLYEPWEVVNQQDQPYRVFTPFWKAMQAKGIDLPIRARPRRLSAPDVKGLKQESVKTLGLLPEINWDKSFYACWNPGETGAAKALNAFIENAIKKYDKERDIPGIPGTSQLSPHLHFGEISPRQIVRQVLQHDLGGSRDAQRFLSEIGWREFSYYLLYHFPETTEAPLNSKFGQFPWAKKTAVSRLQAWQDGQTGIPIVDAGMRQLWQTGWMHNRVRMIVASLLTKNCLIHWLEGARWFWDTLVDADLASNTQGWQWVAGSGADAAPYFRIFNPVRQGERFDPAGDYVRKWVPEIAELPNKHIHTPWEAPKKVLAEAGIHLGQDYPNPIVDLKESRERALAAYNSIK